MSKEHGLAIMTPLGPGGTSVRCSTSQSDSLLSRAEITLFTCCYSPKIKSIKFQFGAQYKGTRKRQSRLKLFAGKGKWDELLLCFSARMG